MLDPHLLPPSGDYTEKQAGCRGDEASVARSFAEAPQEPHYSGVAYFVCTTARIHVQGQDLRVWGGRLPGPEEPATAGSIGIRVTARAFLGGIRHGAASEVRPGCPGVPHPHPHPRRLCLARCAHRPAPQAQPTKRASVVPGPYANAPGGQPERVGRAGGGRAPGIEHHCLCCSWQEDLHQLRSQIERVHSVPHPSSRPLQAAHTSEPPWLGFKPVAIAAQGSPSYLF